MDALNNILNRVSARELSMPHPTKDEMNLVYKAALRAPDHAWLRPSSFIEVSGDGLKKLSSIFFKFGESINASDEIKEKYKNAPYRAPMIIILITLIIFFDLNNMPIFENMKANNFLLWFNPIILPMKKNIFIKID